MSKWITEQEEQELSKKELKALKKQRKADGITAKAVLKELDRQDAEDAADEDPEMGDGTEDEIEATVEGDAWAGMLPEKLTGDDSEEADMARTHAHELLDVCQQIIKDMPICLNSRVKAIAQRKLTTKLTQVGKDFRSATVAVQKK